MNINDMAKLYENLNRINNINFEDTTETNRNFLNEVNQLQSKLGDLTSLSTESEQFMRTSSNLTNFINRLDNISTSYRNPVTNEVDATNQTIDRMQSDRLKSNIRNFVEHYNTALNRTGTDNFNNYNERLRSLDLPDNAEELGIIRNEDGSLSFNEERFDNTVQAGQTTIESINELLTGVGNYVARAQNIIGDLTQNLQSYYDEIITELEELRTNFNEEYQNFFDMTLNRTLDTVMSSFFSSLGIGQNFSDVV